MSENSTIGEKKQFMCPWLQSIKDVLFLVYLFNKININNKYTLQLVENRGNFF